jgi:hypothetical protein
MSGPVSTRAGLAARICITIECLHVGQMDSVRQLIGMLLIHRPAFRAQERPKSSTTVSAMH